MLISRFSQQQKILTLMCRANPKDKWFFPYDFMRDDLGDLFVGYEASARLSELAHDYPDMVESTRDGKYIKRRLRLDQISQWLPLLPKDLRYILHRAGLTHKHLRVSKITPDEPGKLLHVDAVYVGRSGIFDANTTHTLALKHLEIGKPVVVMSPKPITYKDLKAFRRDWKAV